MSEPAAGTAEQGDREPRVDTSLPALVARAQRGDQDAFRTLYRTLAPRLLNYLRALVGEHDAEDIASEAWAAISRDLTKYHASAGEFRGWATTIARHRAIDHLRRARPVTPLPNHSLPEHQAPDDTEADAHAAITTAGVLSMISQLPPDQAEAVLLRVILGLDATTAGRILRKRPGTVRTAAYRGLRTLAARLASCEHPAER